jgi:hypothetical protein
MNRTGRLALVPLVLLCSGATFGQITDAMKTAPNVDAGAIQRFVDAAAKNLAGDDADKQSKAREDLSNGVQLAAGNTTPLSPVFADAYAGAVAKALAPLTGHEDMRVRLNAAIVNARVAERVGNTRLKDVTGKFINDKTNAVALWGVKAARAMLPAILAGPNAANDPLLVAMVQAVQRAHYGPIVTEVYEALGLNVITANPKPPPNVIKGAVPEMLQVLRSRVDDYAGGVPPDPGIDNTASEFFSFSTVWQQMTPQQRTDAVQAMTDLLALAGQHAALMEGEERQPLLTVFKRTGSALQVIGDAVKSSALSNAAKEIQRVSTGMDGTEVSTRSTALAAAARTAFPGLKPAPTLPVAPPDAAEATGTPADQAPADKEGKAPAPGATTGGGTQPKSAAPGTDTDTARTAGDAAPGGNAVDAGTDPAAPDNTAAPAPADAKAPAPAPRPPQRPGRPPR